MVDILNNSIRIAIGEFLNIMIIQNKYIFISFWSIVHLIVGGLIMYLLIKYKIGKNSWKFSWLLVLLVVFEAFEFMCYTKWFTAYFLVEETIDVVWDIIIGMLGGLLMYLFVKRKNK